MENTSNINVTHKAGMGWFFFALIPGALAGAALMWMAFYTGVIGWRKAQRIEARMDNRVGVNGELVAPVDLIIRKDRGCAAVSRAFLDSGQLTLYITNSCPGKRGYIQYHCNQVAPDGVILKSDWNYVEAEMESGETIEKAVTIDPDRRTVKIVVWAYSEHDF